MQYREVDPLVGRCLGQYQILELVGRGAMGVVYKALQPVLHRHVALKVLPPNYSVYDPAFRDRFEREAEVLARLDHPSILPIYDFGREGSYFYLVMPLVGGGTMD